RRTGDDIKQLAPAWPLVQYINQTGSLRRYKADRLIELRALAGEDRQRAQIERDISNVEWTADAAEAIAELMEQTEQAMKTGEKLTRDPKPTDATPEADDAADVTADLAAKLEGTEVAGTRPLSIAAVIDLDLATEQAREHLPRTLQRLAACTELDRVVLLTSTPESVRSAINIDGLDVVCMQPTNAINEGRRSLVRHARALSPHHWRGGLGNATAADSLYDPKRLDEAVNELDLDAALLIGTDWSYLDPATTDDIIARHRQAPDKFRITFAAAGVGLAPVLVSKTIAEEITRGADAPWLLSSVGTLLNYVPVAPQLDLLGKSHCVHVSPAMRDAMLACTATSQIGAAITQQSEPFADAEHIAQLARTVRPDAPAELVLELCPGRHTGGRLARLHWNADEQPERHTIDTALAKRFATELARLDTNAVLTLAGAGDPLLHPGVFAIIEHAKASGVGTVHVCTDLLDDAGTQLAESGADIVSVDLLATSRKTYQALAGIDGYDRAINNIETLLAIAADRTKAGDGMWVVPRITRCDAVYDELEQFYDHWLMRAGCCVIDPLPRAQVGDRIEPIALPALARERLSRTRLCIRSDGRALIDATDFATRAGLQATSLPLSEVWQTVLRSRLAEQAADIEPKPTTREVAA
ncbi:MAG: radical SAM protein, partial [Planctomycetota bacterium]